MKIGLLAHAELDIDTEIVQFMPPLGRTLWPPVAQWTDRDWTHWLQEHERLFASGWTDAAIAHYLTHDRYDYGFGLLPNGERVRSEAAGDKNVSWLYLPTPIGVTLHKNPAPNLLWGGSAGGSKSMTAHWEMISACWDTKRDDYRVIVVRRELEQLRRTHLDKMVTNAARIGRACGDMDTIKVTTHPPVATFKRTSAKTIFAHCQNPGDEEKYLSEDYDLDIVDESTRLLQKQIIGIQGRVRNDTKINRIGRMILTTNPGGPSHGWHARHFITNEVPLTENERYDPADYAFVQARLYDNPYYMDADGSYRTYEKRLYAYDAERRKQLLDGDWSATVGQFFRKFSASTHVYDTQYSSPLSH